MKKCKICIKIRKPTGKTINRTIIGEIIFYTI